MDDVKERIAQILSGVSQGRKTRATKEEKEAFLKLSEQVEGIRKDIDKLNLRLWHACYKNDYHSLSLDSAREELINIKAKIDDVLE